MPSYNPLLSFILILEDDQEKDISKCIDSLLAQTYKNIEIICVDNRTNNLTMNSYLNNPLIKLFTNDTHTSCVINKNKGLDLANGKFISLINVTDYITPYFAQIVVSTFITEKAEIVQIQSLYLDENNNILDDLDITGTLQEYQKSKIISFSHQNAYKYLPNSNKNNKSALCINNFIFSKSFLLGNKLSFTSNSIIRDDILNFQSIGLSNKTTILPYIACFHNHNDQLENNNIKIHELIDEYNKFLDFIIAIDDSKCYTCKKSKAKLANHIVRTLVNLISRADIDLVESISFLVNTLYLSFVQNYYILDKVVGINLFLKHLEPVYSKTNPELWQYLKDMLLNNISQEEKLQSLHAITSEQYTVSLAVNIENTPNDTLEDCITSIQKQSYSHIEVIFLINKNSTKEQKNKIKTFAENNSNVKILCIDNLNFRNILDNITGTYISFITSNTILHKHYIYLLMLELNMKEDKIKDIIIASHSQELLNNNNLDDIISSTDITTETTNSKYINQYNIATQDSYQIIYLLSLFNKLIPSKLFNEHIESILSVNEMEQNNIIVTFLTKDVPIFYSNYKTVYHIKQNNLTYEEQVEQLGIIIENILKNTALLNKALTYLLPYILDQSSKFPLIYKTALIQQHLENSIITYSEILHTYKVHWINIIENFCVTNKISYYTHMIKVVPYLPEYKGGIINDIKQYLYNVEKNIFYNKNKNNGVLICEYFSGNTYILERHLVKANIPFRKIDLFALERCTLNKEKIIIEKAKKFNIVITDYLTPLLQELNQHQIVINLWKGIDAFDPGFYKYHTYANKIGYSMYNICSSQKEKKHIAYNFATPIQNVLPLGNTRTDIFFDENLMQEKQNEFFDRHPAYQGKRIYLFIPTYRKYKTPCINLNFTNISKLLSDDEILLIKEHPLAQRHKKTNNMFAYKFSQLKSKVADVSDEDINTLLKISDVVISDYSSLIADAILLNKPVVFYAEDFTSYIKKHIPSFDHSHDLPGSLLETPDENLFINLIRNARIDYKKYKTIHKEYLTYCDGNATKRLLKLIHTLMKHE